MKLKWHLLLLFALCLPVPAFAAAGNIHYEALQIHPFVSVQEAYTDNVFAVATNTEHDWITTLTPGISLLLPYGRHSFSADYRVAYAMHSRFASEDTTDQYANGMADLKLGSLFGLKLSDAYTKGHEPRNSSTSGEIEKYEKNAATVVGTYQLADRSKVQVDYTRDFWNFAVNDYRDRQEDLVAAYVYYRFLPRTSGFIEYDFRNFNYDQKQNGLDSKTNYGFLGVMWEMSAITKGTVKAGYLSKQFDASGQEGLRTWTASADVNHAFSESASIRLVALRDANESSALGTRYYITTGAYGQYTQKLAAKISGVARISYGVDDYSNPIPPDTLARYDKTFVGGVGLKYQMRDWLEFALDYDHRNRDSNIDVNDMVENTYSLTVNFAL
jgi:polysaccharide biosynthesis protein VpsM